MNPDKNVRLDLSQRRDYIGTKTDVYMERRQFFAIRLFGKIYQLRQHVIRRRDHDPNPHTHPWPFFSLIVKNGYDEQMYDAQGNPTTFSSRRRWSICWRPKSAVHNIVALHNNEPVTTIVLAIHDVNDPQYGDWGFIENGMFVHERDYLDRQEQQGRRVQPNGEKVAA